MTRSQEIRGGMHHRGKVVAPGPRKQRAQVVLFALGGKIRTERARDSGAPRQIRTAAPASGGRKSGGLLVENAPTSAYLLGSTLTTDALADPACASVVAIPLPRDRETHRLG